MTSERIEELRNMMKNHDKFADIQTYFFDHFTDHDAFIDACRRYQDPKIKRMLNQMLIEVPTASKQPLRIIEMITLRYTGTDLIHGTGPLNTGGIVSFLYFENDDIGLVGIVKSRFHGGETIFMRLKMVKPDGEGALFKKTDLNLN